jgi:predicted GTPase
MSESEDFRKSIEKLIDQMIARLPEEMQSIVRKQLAHQREVAWMARTEALKAQEKQKRLEAEAKIAADSAEQELMRLLVSSLSRHLGQTDPGNVKNDVELILKLNREVHGI